MATGQMIEATSTLGYFEPQIHFSSSAPRLWRQKKLSMGQLRHSMEVMRMGVKAHTGYRWDNNHFFIDDIFGHPALKVVVMEGDMCLWEANFNTHVGDFETIPPDIDEWIRRIAEKKVRCSECGEWFGAGEWRHFSFAGAVCEADYNPAKHKGPDTRGN